MLDFRRSIAGFAARQTLRAFSKASPASIKRAARVLGFVAPKNYNATFETISKAADEGHPLIQVVKNLGEKYSIKCQQKLVNNLLINQYFLGERIRKRTKEREKVQIPTFIVISPTYACNLKCMGCYAGEYGNKYHLEKELVFDIIKQANDCGIYFFTISGGEPFTWPHLFEMFEKFSDSYFLIYTNGTLLDDETCRKLAILGNATPAVSIEGYEKDTCGRRGEGMYDTIMGAFERMRKYGVFFGASVTHTAMNHEAVVDEAFWDSIIDNGCGYAWVFHYIPIGMKPDVKLMPTPQQRLERYKVINKIRSTRGLLIADFWNDGNLARGCMAGGAQYLHINAKGMVEPCVFQHFAVDNIREKSLLDVLRSPYFEAIRSQIPYDDNLLTPCMIIDHPEIMKEINEKYGAIETHDGASSITGEFHEFLKSYSGEWKDISKEVWEKEFPNKSVLEKGTYTYKGEDSSVHRKSG